MNEDTSTRLPWRELDNDDTLGLNPARVIAGAKRRRSRSRAATAITSVAVASVAIGGLFGVGGRDEPQVAGFGGPSGIAPNEPSARPTTDDLRGNLVPSAQTSQPIPRPRSKWTAGGPIGAQPIGTIPVSGRVEIAAKYWFETRGTKWCISETSKSPAEADAPFGCRGTIGNANIGDGRVPGIQSSSDANGQKVVTSVFRGDARRVIYTDGSKFYEAKLYRLAAVPGWMLAVASYKRPTGDKVNIVDSYVFTYDDRGKVVAQFPTARDGGGPKTDPLA